MPEITWRRVPQIIRPAYVMLVDGQPNGWWIHATQHQTCLRPYCVIRGLPKGEIMSIQLHGLANVQAEAERLFKETLTNA